ncbi:Crp/Fnr family transcriptional regulator [Sphingobacterium spiritivorum]|uniref:Crp/Fnr family transcriptional regulator n=1 Tax=Sphingobacterium spiritivorum TaxID=258 RepID=UPI003DA3A56C
MLRTNLDLLSYISGLYNGQDRKEDIILRKFEKGQLLLQQGDPLSRLFIVNDGITKCYFREENGKEFVVEFLGKGEILGEVEVISRINCLCSIEVLAETEAFSIAVPYFRMLLEKDIVFNRLLMESFSSRIVNTSSRASFQQLYTVEYNLSKLLQLQSDQQLDISKEDMAAYLGITIRSLNRALKSLQ